MGGDFVFSGRGVGVREVLCVKEMYMVGCGCQLRCRVRFFLQ